MNPGLEFVFRAEVAVAPPLVVGKSSHGVRRIIPILGGKVEGPRFSGEVLAGGADWQYERPDGVWELEARYTLRAGDGALIQVINRALRHGPPAVMERIFRGDAVGPEEYYFRTVAEFEAPIGPHDWLNKGIFVGIAERRRDAAIVRFHLVT
ncbi:MAG: DUF3237 domain-containing protein [Proteobacteria bacterium]|jgi:hypothetical protein|nr:DUF3237 domain-containing protein [Pseudomonadota bacterium]MBK7114643.1 DUF3237 domain-containing protein [Pseudomonadota bacterium]MBK9252871.1 DUF3237 domain-containing protein [Pseudomonadota bacterium]MCC6632364.1 DUF3237 domain-containing protein [Gammaproteobacteria bacterium]